jgi:hypothetical protein
MKIFFDVNLILFFFYKNFYKYFFYWYTVPAG